MTDMSSISNERISALIDGDLHAGECADVLNRLLVDTESIQTWHVYQVVGDVLRSPELAPGRGDLAFLGKLEQRLAQELESQSVSLNFNLSETLGRSLTATESICRPAGNESVYRWKVLAGVACSALVAVVGSGLWSETNLRLEGDFALGNSGNTTALIVGTETPVGPMLRDPRLDELITAHRQLGGHSALQIPAGFLRNATYEGSGQ
jgi:sigma-E factor negative regulatory protein RseA